MRVDIFGIKPGGTIDGPLQAPLGRAAKLKPGQSYLPRNRRPHAQARTPVHPGNRRFERSLGRSEADQRRPGDRPQRRERRDGEVDPWSHFINVFMLDQDGNRIDRRNPQDIFVPLYNHQIPPGPARWPITASSSWPASSEPVTIEVKLQYRKFDKRYMDFVTASEQAGDIPIRGHQSGQPYVNPLPVTTLAVDRVTLPVEGGPDARHQRARRFRSGSAGTITASACCSKAKAEPKANCGKRPTPLPKSKSSAASMAR